MAYTMIEPIKQTLFEVDNLMKYRNYQPVVDKITEIIEQVSAFLFLYALEINPDVVTTESEACMQ